MIFSEDTKLLKLSGNELKKYRQRKKILELLYNHDSLSGSVLSKKKLSHNIKPNNGINY